MRVQRFLSRPDIFLRGEAWCSAVASCVVPRWLFPHHWGMFATLCLVPDTTLLLYARGSSAVASMAYNVAHSYVLPALPGALASHSGSALPGQVSLIWIGHIGLDQLPGFGLKYRNSLAVTHLHSAANSADVPALTPTYRNALSRATACR